MCVVSCIVCREYKEDLTDVYSNVNVKPDASMAQLWETAVKDEKQEKKLIAGVSCDILCYKIVQIFIYLKLS